MGKREICGEVNMRPYVSRSIRQLRSLLDGMTIGMVTTQTAHGASLSRPMLVRGMDDAGWLWFLADRDSRQACELSQNPLATVAFQSKRGDRYVSVQGTAVVVRDDVRPDGLWNRGMRTWFPRGRRDPEIALIAVRVTRAEYWLVPTSGLAGAFGMAKAMMTGRRHTSGRHGSLDLQPLIV